MRLLVGTIVCMLSLAIIDDSLVQMLGMAVVCTAGLALIVILPVFYLVGAIVMFFIEKIIPSAPMPADDAAMVTSVKPPEKALIGYIQNCASKEWSSQRIYEELKFAGWSDREIAAGFEFCRNVAKLQ